VLGKENQQLRIGEAAYEQTFSIRLTTPNADLHMKKWTVAVQMGRGGKQPDWEEGLEIDWQQCYQFESLVERSGSFLLGGVVNALGALDRQWRSRLLRFL